MQLQLIKCNVRFVGFFSCSFHSLLAPHYRHSTLCMNFAIETTHVFRSRAVQMEKTRYVCFLRPALCVRWCCFRQCLHLKTGRNEWSFCD